jgi:putative DNA primase/helicase
MALALIWDCFDEFPYVDEASKANMLALLLTPLVRPMINGAIPLALIDKPAAGTGASLLADAITGVLAGSTARRINESRDGDEWRKSITTALRLGATIIIMDNLDKSVGSPALAQAITTGTCEDRALGTNTVIRVKVRATWIATGNNLRVKGDMARRSYWIRLNANQARPWLGRKFRHSNLLAWIENHRGALLAACLTIVRAWVVAQKPPPRLAPKLGGFEGWSQTIGGILEHAGMTDFLGNLGALYESVDEEDAPWTEFLRACTTASESPSVPHNLWRDLVPIRPYAKRYRPS